MSLERSWDLAEEAERNALGIKVARDREFCECNAEQVRKQAKRSFETMLDDCMWNGDCEIEPMSEPKWQTRHGRRLAQIQQAMEQEQGNRCGPFFGGGVSPRS